MTSHVAGHPYQVVATQIVDRIDAGRIAPGDKLPSVRALARDADVSAMTAQKALTHLAELGYADVVSGLGYFVADRKQQASDLASLESVTQQLDQLQQTVAHLSDRLDRLETAHGDD